MGININTNIAGQTTGHVGFSQMQFYGSVIPLSCEGQRIINRVELMPNIPSPFQMKDWKAVAQGFDDFVFDFSLTGDYLPIIWWDTTGRNFDRDIFALPDHVGRYDQSGGTHSFFTSMGSVLSATLVGIDKSRQWCEDTSSYQNWVLQCENYFNIDSGEDLFLSFTYQDTGSTEYLYELYPSVLAFQLNYYYPSVGDFENELIITADKWHSACVAMGGEHDPWTVPDFYWTAFDFDTMTPVYNGSYRQPSSAGSFAWIGYMAWKKVGRSKLSGYV